METNNFNLNTLKPFYIGQKIICCDRRCDGHWIDVNNESFIGPKYGDVVTVRGYGQGVLVEEFPNSVEGYNVIYFKPLQEQKLKLISYTKVLEKELVSEN